MLSFVAHTLLVLVVVVGLWAWWLSLTGDRVVRALTGVGLLVRAVPGFALFWVSQNRWPVGRSLQAEPGFWFFGIDGITYFHVASKAAFEGLHAILTIDPKVPSVFYVKTLAMALYFLGQSPATSLLVNLMAYAGLCGVICRWSAGRAVDTVASRVTIAIVSLMPSWILWTYQPLKDTLLLLLLAAFYWVTDLWLNHLARRDWSWRRGVAFVAALAVLVYGIAGMRWYMGPVVVITVLLGLAAALMIPGRRSAWRAVGALCSLLIVAEANVPGAGPYLPQWMRELLRPSPGNLVARVVDAPNRAASDLERAHQGSARASGATQIHIAGDDERVADRMRASIAVLTLPRWLASRVGHLTVGGGRGLWAFVDIDTACFDVALVAVAAILIRRWRSGDLTHPGFWPVAAMTSLVAILLALEAVNFGTLFRVRSMLALGIALLPLGVGSSGKDPATHASPP